jgi:hypothetical protein
MELNCLIIVRDKKEIPKIRKKWLAVVRQEQTRDKTNDIQLLHNWLVVVDPCGLDYYMSGGIEE